MIMYFKI